jgi:uncharacterized protein YdaU (DUF1376 family)
MNYYKRHIGDYSKKAGRLSMLQHGAYNQLIDACYDREKFPTRAEAVDWVWAITVEEIAAVDFVLNRFFKLVDGVYVQDRIQEELDRYHQNAATNKRIAQEREANRRKKKSTDRKQGVDGSPPNQEPRTTNQEPRTTKKSIPAEPKYSPQDLEFSKQMLETLRFDDPEFKQPNLEQWAKTIRLMRERDNRQLDKMGIVWQWARSNHFWQANILSADSFRRNYDKLTAQIRRQQNPPPLTGRQIVRAKIMDIEDISWGDGL